MQYGFLLWLLLLAWSPLLARPMAVAQQASGACEKDASTTARPDVMTAPQSGALATTEGELTPVPTPLQSDSQEDVVPTASKLSPRLTLLATWATAGTMPADVGEQDRLLGLAASGAGSLSRDSAGNPVVEVRMLDTSAETIAALTALPADVLSIAPEYSTVTLAIAPERLGNLASLGAVQYVGEVIQPGGRSPGGVPGGGIAPSAP